MNRYDSYINIHLVSDATGETLNTIMRATNAKFDRVQLLERNHYLVRSVSQLERILTHIEGHPGLVWYTLTDTNLRLHLEAYCRERNIPNLSVLDPSVQMLSRHAGVAPTERVAGQHMLDDEYFARMEAINFALTHDDGQNMSGLHHADVVLVGVSRSSKTPTCVYLANRGVMAGNIPLVPGQPVPQILFELKRPMIVGLRVSPDRLIQIRQQRLLSMQDAQNIDYADNQQVRTEITEANRLFQKQKWVVIDVSRRSVEETAAAILNKLGEKQ